jgi:hypothetical protein
LVVVDGCWLPSQVTDVSDGREATGKASSIKLSTATGSILYTADSETEQVEWISAIEGSVAKIVKQVRTSTPKRMC